MHRRTYELRVPALLARHLLYPLTAHHSISSPVNVNFSEYGEADCSNYISYIRDGRYLRVLRAEGLMANWIVITSYYTYNDHRTRLPQSSSVNIAIVLFSRSCVSVDALFPLHSFRVEYHRLPACRNLY